MHVDGQIECLCFVLFFLSRRLSGQLGSLHSRMSGMWGSRWSDSPATHGVPVFWASSWFENHFIRQKVTSEDFVHEVKILFNDLFYGHGLVVNLGRKLEPGGIVLRCARL